MEQNETIHTLFVKYCVNCFDGQRGVEGAGATSPTCMFIRKGCFYKTINSSTDPSTRELRQNIGRPSSEQRQSPWIFFQSLHTREHSKASRTAHSLMEYWFYFSTKWALNQVTKVSTFGGVRCPTCFGVRSSVRRLKKYSCGTIVSLGAPRSTSIGPFRCGTHCYFSCGSSIVNIDFERF